MRSWLLQEFTMTSIIDAKPERRVSARLAAGVAISALLVLGAFVTPAAADDHHGGDRDHRGDRGHEGRNRGYYAPPPVVYAAPYYAPPPVVYDPAIGVYMPGISIGIQ
jgi:hypothetical protein